MSDTHTSDNGGSNKRAKAEVGGKQPLGPVGQPGSREAPQPRSRFTLEHRIMLELMIEARKNAGLSQAALAKKLGKFQAHINSVEVGGRDINAVELYRWCQATQLPIKEFFERFEAQLNEAQLCQTQALPEQSMLTASNDQ